MKKRTEDGRPQTGMEGNEVRICTNLRITNETEDGRPKSEMES
ncbi:MAG: hypothetical protein V2A54_13050 [Bacteroidota bacterium]